MSKPTKQSDGTVDDAYDPLEGVPEPPPYRPDPLLVTYIERSYPPSSAD